MQVFGRILDLTSGPDRAAVLPQIESGYLEVIDTYPKAPLVHEAYWRLMQMYVNDYSPPAFSKAEALYVRYRAAYPELKNQNPVGDVLAEGYYRRGEWKKLLKFTSPAVKEFIQTGALARPHDLFLYTEAKYNLGDHVEAEKGYRIVAAKFPKAPQAAEAKQRLDAIRAKKEKKQ
ncbi:MAG: hypothetical protein OHK006_02190 [Thermodesulfovibrionales bacterium]